MSLPAPPLRINRGTWAVPARQLPAVAHFLHDVLPNEPWDPHFQGQELATTYFDTARLALRKARAGKRRYLTLRLRCYRPPAGEPLYALSAKTEREKWRGEVEPGLAELVLAGEVSNWPATLLPAHLLARLQEIAGSEALAPAVAVCCRRYAVEGPEDRYTLDCEVAADTGKRLPHAVLELKSTAPDAQAPPALRLLQPRPIKLSKFLWATGA